jgi:integrase
VPELSFSPHSLGRSLPRERHQHGWVKKTGQRTKKWVGHWYEYVTTDGVEKRLPREKVLGKCTEMSKGAAEEALRQLIRGVRPATSRATFEELGRWYLKSCEGKWNVRTTRQTMASLFEHQIFPRLGGMIASEIRKSDVQQAINDIAADPRSGSGSTVKKCLTHIRATFEAAVDDGLLDKNPARKVEMPNTRKASERFLSMDECKRLLLVAPEGDRLILRILLSCGLRPSELFALKVDDVLPGQLRIDEAVVRGEVGETKTEGSNALLSLAPTLEGEIREYIREYKIRNYLFATRLGTPISPENYLDRDLQPLGVRAGIDVYTRTTKRGEEIETSKLNFQVLRRTCATHFQKHGTVKDAQAHMRHANAETTLRHYQKTLDETLVAAVHSFDQEFIQ